MARQWQWLQKPRCHQYAALERGLPFVSLVRRVPPGPQGVKAMFGSEQASCADFLILIILSASTDG